MIPYVNILDKYSLLPKALVEPSQCWFEVSYYEFGEFEVYAPATESNLKALKRGNYVTIPHRDYVWVIVSVQYEFNSDGARMIDVKGFEAKWLLSKRAILSTWNLGENLDVEVCKLINISMGTTANSYRKIKGFFAQTSGLDVTIEPTQASRQQLSDFVLALIKANKIGCETRLVNNQIVYKLKKGRDLSDSILFSQSMDNLISATYFESDDTYKTYCQVVSTFNQNNQTTEYIGEYPDVDEDNYHPTKGIDRNEMTLASNISTKYIDENGVERETTPSDDPNTLYGKWLIEAGKNALSEHTPVVQFEGEIDLRYSNYIFGEDFDVGDIVKVRDEFFGYESTTRILKYTFKQDASGYGEECEYGNE